MGACLGDQSWAFGRAAQSGARPDGGRGVGDLLYRYRCAHGSPDVDERAKHVEDLKKYVDLAADLGCDMVRSFGGPCDRRQEFIAVVDYVADGFAQVLEHAADHGVVLLCLRPMTIGMLRRRSGPLSSRWPIPT